jgi:hypothetical protein
MRTFALSLGALVALASAHEYPNCVRDLPTQLVWSCNTGY